ncbi:hypothetical protein HJG60_009773 [Phyllostomus discolor]|uniref:Uncharacterized protein n=1 Tax=Phyllostomus discolor TaxID=89673 RepID=A0A834EQ85_9CHIR|nr:hypothetical protein HJG60_009773 [Phyllostomus discolor]
MFLPIHEHSICFFFFICISFISFSVSYNFLSIGVLPPLSIFLNSYKNLFDSELHLFMEARSQQTEENAPSSSLNFLLGILFCLKQLYMGLFSYFPFLIVQYWCIKMQLTSGYLWSPLILH